MGALIVFLPGLKGNEQTWGIVPELIKRSPGTNFEIATLTYSTRVGSPSDLSRSAGLILTKLEHDFSGRSPIYLVGYSLGGLVAREVCRQLLVADETRDELLDSVRAVISLGTPLEGAGAWWLTNTWNAVLRKTPFLGKKVKELADPERNFERYKEAIKQRVQIRQANSQRKARRPKQIHIEIEDDVTVAPNTTKFYTDDDMAGGIVAGTHRSFAEDAESAKSLADLILSLIRNVQNASNPTHGLSRSSAATADLPQALVLIPCSRTKAPGGEKGHDGSIPAEWLLPAALRERVVNKRSNVFGLIRDARIADAFDRGANRMHQRANQTLHHGPDLGGLAVIGDNCFYLPAWQRYTGRSYVPIKPDAWLDHFSEPQPFTVLIMSGLYGLIDAQEKIQDYDIHLSDSNEDTGQTVKSMWTELYTETIKSYVERAFKSERIKIYNLLCDINYVTAVEWLELPKKKCTVYHLASPTLADVNLLPAAGTILNRLLREPQKIAEIEQGVEQDLSDFGQPPQGQSDLRVIFDRRFGDSKKIAE